MFSFKSKSTSPRPAHHANDQQTAFKNPWPSANPPTWAELLQGSFPLSLYESSLRKHVRARDVNVVVPDWGVSSLKAQGLEKEKCVVGTWLGHASAMVEIPLVGTSRQSGGQESFWVLFDPIFSMRAGPTQYTGSSRINKSPCQVTDLPGCDAVVISHNHYDHLDLLSIQAISKKFPEARYFVPLGNKAWLSSIGISISQIYELDWWQNREYSLEDLGHIPMQDTQEDTLIRVTCVPAQHNSGRGAIDQGKTLWSGWVIEQLLTSKDPSAPSSTRRKGAIYHAGDTGYRPTAKSTSICPVFSEIGQKLGPFDLSFVPIWRGGTLGFVSYVGLRLSHHDIPSTLHASPADAVDIHMDVRSRNTVGVHFGTFVGSENESLEAIIEFEEAREEKGLGRLEEGLAGENGRAGVLDIGGSFAVEMEMR